MNFLESLQKLILDQHLYDPELVKLSFAKHDLDDILDMVGELIAVEQIKEALSNGRGEG